MYCKFKTAGFKQVSYRDEVRSYTAEKMFERNGRCLLRSDIKEIHEHVTKLYSEFVEEDETPSKQGYIYASCDSPL